ncbi:hypothetical protein QEN19_000208 [Hanseniaspora menglaensis]
MYLFESIHDGKCVTLFMGKDKFENDFMIKYFYKEMNTIWLHVDKYSSSHVYVKLNASVKSDTNISDIISQNHLNDAIQLCKANSISANKLQKAEIVVTPFINLKKSGEMNPGQVSFKSTRFLKYLTCFSRDNAVINRLEKTKIIIDEEPNVDEAFLRANFTADEAESFFNIVVNAEEEDKIVPNKEEFLRKCKKSKNGNYMVDFVNKNRDRLILVEALRKKLKKISNSKSYNIVENNKKKGIVDGIDYSEFYE